MACHPDGGQICHWGNRRWCPIARNLAFRKLLDRNWSVYWISMAFPFCGSAVGEERKPTGRLLYLRADSKLLLAMKKTFGLDKTLQFVRRKSPVARWRPG